MQVHFCLHPHDSRESIHAVNFCVYMYYVSESDFSQFKPFHTDFIGEVNFAQSENYGEADRSKATFSP